MGGHSLVQMLLRLTEPSESVTAPYRRRRARWVGVSCVSIAVAAPVGFAAAVATGATFWLLGVLVFAVPVAVSCLVLARTSAYQLAGIVVCGSLTVLVVVAIVGAQTPSIAATVIAFLSIPVGVAMGVFSVRRTAAIAGVAITTALVLTASGSVVDSMLAVPGLVFVLVSSVLLVGGAVVLDQDRRELDQVVASARTIFDGAFEGLVIHADGVVIEANRAQEEMLGVPPGSLPGRHYSEFVRPEHVALTERRIRAGGLQEYEIDVTRSDGTTLPVSVVSRPWVFDGRPARIAGMRDLSAERQAARQLELALETGSMGLWELNVDPPGFVMSPGLLALYGIEPGSRFADRREPWLNLVNADDYDGIAAAFDEGFFGSGAFEVEFGVVTRPGRRFWTRGRAVRTSAGEVVGLIGIAIDITDRIALGERVRRSERLETVGRLAGGVAHDFNNLLTVVGGYANLARDLVRPDEPIATYLDEIAVAAERGSRLTGQLLAFGGRQVQQLERLELNDVVDDTHDLISRLVGEDVEYVTCLGAQLSPVYADRSHLELVLVNLALNARDAMPTGGTFTVATSATSAASGVRLVAADTGTGMTDDVRARVFEPFFTTKENGTGLGLASVYGVVTQCGGRVLVDSRPGWGATFTIELPAARVEAGDAGARSWSGLRRPAAGERILLVEDDDTIRRLSATVLGEAGYDVVSARDPAEAEALASHLDRIDGLVTDVVMPGMSGLELARRLSADHGPLRTLFSSGYSDEVIARRGEVPEGGAFLSKPFTPEELRAAVGALLAVSPDVPSKTP